MKDTEATAVGFDIGGTKTAGVLITLDGKIIRRIERQTLAREGGPAVLSRALDLASELVTQSPHRIIGIGIAAGGQIDPRTGVVLHATEVLPGWTGTEIASAFSERFQLPAKAMNDANAAALGEWRYGAARGVDDFVLLTLGTGIGGGIVAGGKLIQGDSGAAGHTGHLVIRPGGRACSCGGRGCLEAYASGTAIADRALELSEERGVNTELISAVRSNRSSGAKLLGQAAKGGDDFALEVIREAGEFLGWGLVSILNLLNPRLVVLGGGMSELGDALIRPAEEIARAHALKVPAESFSITRAALGNDAGMLGAASLAWGEFDEC